MRGINDLRFWKVARGHTIIEWPQYSNQKVFGNEVLTWRQLWLTRQIKGKHVTTSTTFHSMSPPKVCQAEIDSSQCSRNLQYIWPEGCEEQCFFQNLWVITRSRQRKTNSSVTNSMNSTHSINWGALSHFCHCFRINVSCQGILSFCCHFSGSNSSDLMKWTDLSKGNAFVDPPIIRFSDW